MSAIRNHLPPLEKERSPAPVNRAATSDAAKQQSERDLLGGRVGITWTLGTLISPRNSLSLRSPEFDPPFSREGSVTRFDRTRFKTERAQQLRREGTKPQAKLRYALRDARLGVSFRRQHPIGPYVVDFYCSTLKLAIELDGGQHCSQVPYDERRAQFLKGKGIRVVRFWNVEVNENFDGICERIAEIVRGMTPTRNAARSGLRSSGGDKQRHEASP